MANKKPKSPKLPTSKFTTTKKSVPKTKTGAAPVGGRRTVEQSEESKVIKRVNEQMKNLTNWIAPEDNNYISAYVRALDKSGVDYVIKTAPDGSDQYVIRNTRENRQKVDALRAELNKQKARTMRDIRAQISSDLKSKGQKVTKQAVDKELEYWQAYGRLESNASFAYGRKGTPAGKRMNDILAKMDETSRGANPDEYREYVLQLDREVEAVRRAERKTAYKASKIRTKGKTAY